MQENSHSPELIAQLLASIEKNGALLAGKKVTAGFDGFIDRLVKIIKNKENQLSPVLFKQIEEFGDYILEKKGSSFSMELEEGAIKAGGNMPITANALGHLGVHVTCIGALGYPQPHSIFKALHSNCDLYSFADPGTCTAFEFNDGKIFFGHMGALNKLDWTQIKNIIGLNTLVKLFEESDLLCIVNWSEIDRSTDIWKGLLKDVLPSYHQKHHSQIAFFDLSDCSKRPAASITEALSLLQEFSKFTKVMLSLNRNEAKLVYQVLFNRQGPEDVTAVGKDIFGKLGIDTLVLHSAKEAIAFNHQTTGSCNSFFVTEPKISTGAGDHFNAGFCAAHLMGLDLDASLIFASAVAGFYIRSAQSPGLPDIVLFLEEIIPI